jgi:CheY-like chemotaxis protein
MLTRPNLTILLAEDNPINQKIALIFLKKLGYDADLANNGQEVLLALEGRPYDLVLMDIQMPEIDGIEATRMIRERFAQGPKIIVVTAFNSSSFRKLCMDAGADDFINKPVKMEELGAAIERNMGDSVLQCLRLPDIDCQVQDLDNMGHAI